MEKSKYKAVIFDYDDTLVGSIIPKWAQHKHVGKKFYNIEVTDDMLREHWGKPLPKLVQSLYQGMDTVENMFNALASTKKDFPKNIHDGSLDIIAQILKSGTKVGILSATSKIFLLDDLERHGFPFKEFFVIQTADDTEVHKPDPGVFVPLLEKLEKEGIKKEDVVYVGDAMRDFEAANGAGIDFIAVTTGLHPEDEFKNRGVRNIARNIKDILKFLRA